MPTGQAQGQRLSFIFFYLQAVCCVWLAGEDLSVIRDKSLYSMPFAVWVCVNQGDLNVCVESNLAWEMSGGTI